MSSDVLARVEAFNAKADELGFKGHVLRAAENFGRAAEAASALGADNLVTIYLRLRQGNMLGVYATTAVDTDPRVLAAHGAQTIVVLSDAVAALERRRVAGTLVDGKCSAVEETWRAAVLRRLNSKSTAAWAASWAPLVGYSQFLHAAATAIDVLLDAQLYAVVCSAAQFQAFAEHVVHAAELMQQPRRHGNEAMSIEADLTEQLRDAVAGKAAKNRLDASLVQLLAGAWLRLQRSGVLESRRIEDNIRLHAPRQQALNATVRKSLTAPGLRACALDGCDAKEAHPTHFKSRVPRRRLLLPRAPGGGLAGAQEGVHKAARKAAAAAEDDGAGPSGA